MPLPIKKTTIKITELFDLTSENLKDNWLTTIAAIFLYFIVLMIGSFFPFGGLILSGPLILGLSAYSLKIAREDKPVIETIFEGFNNFGVALGVYLLKTIFIILWTFLFIIPGIIAAIGYSQSFYILAEDKNKNLDPMQVLKKSKEMMNGYKMDYFILMLTFFMFSFVAIFTLGIAFIWLVPYMQITSANFYLRINEDYIQEELIYPSSPDELSLELESFEELD